MRTLLVLALLICGGCGVDVRQAGKSVRQYNDALIVAYRTGDLSPLRPVAREGEIRKVEKLVDLKREAGLVLESTLVTFEVLSTKAAGKDGLVVVTKEQWRYHDRALTPGKPLGPRFVADMRMQYEMERAGNGWRVLKVHTIANELRETGRPPVLPRVTQPGGMR